MYTNINNLHRSRNSATMSGMKTNRQAGYINVLLIPLVAASLLFVVALIFGTWAFNSRQDYKNNTDQKIADAVVVAKEETQKLDAAQYAEEVKQPLKSHVGPDDSGAVTIAYPKTWSAYIVEHTGNTGTPMNNYFHPDVIRDVSESKNVYALRVQVVKTTYSQVMNSFNGEVKSGKVTVNPYKLPKVPSVTGSRIDGQITSQKRGSMVVLPLRNMTLQISTESESFLKDFNDFILPNLSFSP
jgi:hypothetical protein